MRSTINHLIQLQELTLIRDEQRSIRGNAADTHQLDESIQHLSETLEPEAKVIYDRLSKKDHIVMAPMNDGNCSVCGMKLAISQVQGVKQCKTLVACPSCARLLYDPSGAKWVGERPKRSSGERKMGIARFSAPSLMIAELQGTTPREAVEELARKLQENRFVDDAEKLVLAAMDRENTLPTSIGHGLAFPHVRGIEGGGLSLAFGISRKGIFPRIGDYDKWAIKWGYTPMFDAYDSESDHYELEKLVKANLNGNRRLWFGDGETNRYRDPRCQTEDLGDDAVKASGYGLLNLKRMMKQLPEWTFEPNDIHGRNLSEMYSQIRTQYLRYMNHVANYVGGTYIDYKTVSESGPVYTPNPREKQLAALDFIDEQVFTEPTWLREGDFILRLTNSPQNLTESLGNSVLSRMMSSYFISGLNDEFPVAEYLTEMTDRLCKEMWSGQKPTDQNSQ